jgi:aspartyl/asparaginyl beta-hydroxylase (cupin superfamily)/Tfp pilus assembly protein PilF
MSASERKSEIAALELRAVEAARGGQLQLAVDTWARVVHLQPDHVEGLSQLGQAAYAQGDFAAARVAFERAAAADGRQPRQWVNVALACQHLDDDARAETALFKALALDPYDLVALVLRGQLLERQGKASQAASAFGAAASLAPPAGRLAPDLRAALDHAATYCETYRRSLAAFMDEQLEPYLRDCGSAALDRFKLSVDILVGRKKRFESQPMRYFMPQLPTVEFFDRSGFPWLDEVEQAWEMIRDEFLSVLQDDRDFTPYITYGADQPVAQWAELNHSPRWSVFHLVKDGRQVVDNAARCPVTMDVWSRTPSPDQPGRTPVALFSLLKPRTRIPPHVGASNCRLVTHLPLIVPPDCGFRVGNDTRQWVPGKAWVFDDTIEHEAWNQSDQLRVVLIFDTWHPMLSLEERRLVTAMNAALNSFSASSSADYDV